MNYKRLSEVVLVLAMLMALLLHPISLSAEDPTQEIVEALRAYGIAEAEAEISGEKVLISYEQPLAESELSFLATWFYIMEVAAEKAPSAREILIQTNYLGAPFVKISVKTEEVRAYFEGRLDPEQFLAGMGVKELRSPEQVIYDGLLAEGIAEASVTVTEEKVLVSYNQPHVESDQELLGLWCYILGLAVDAAPFVDSVVVQVCFESEPEVVVTARTDDIIAFISEEISVKEFLSRVSIERVAPSAPFPMHLLLFGVAGVAGLAIFALLIVLLVTRGRPAPAAPPPRRQPPPIRPPARPPGRPEGPPERLGGGKPPGPPESLD